MGSIEIVEMLLQAGADKHRETAVLCLVACVSIVALLLQAEADKHHCTAVRPRSCCLVQRHVVVSLLVYGRRSQRLTGAWAVWDGGRAREEPAGHPKQGHPQDHPSDAQSLRLTLEKNASGPGEPMIDTKLSKQARSQISRTS
eukprot:841163-Rhodomonas_salina.2